MIRQMLCIVWLFVLTGCADNPGIIRGAEVIIYPELQRFNIELKNNDLTVGQRQVADIISDLLPVAPDTQWIISYRLRRDASIAKQAVKQLKRAGVRPAQITQRLAPSLNTDIVLEVRQYHLITSTCKPYSLDNNRPTRGCFVDALRMQQVVSPSTLIHAVKE